MVKKKTEEIKEKEDINVKVEEGKRGRVSQSRRRRGGVGGGDGVFVCIHASDLGILTGGGCVWNTGELPSLDRKK